MAKRATYIKNSNNLPEELVTVQDEILAIQKKNADDLNKYQLALIKKREDYKNQLEITNTAQMAVLEKKQNEEIAKELKTRRQNMIKAGKEEYLKAAKAANRDQIKAAKEYEDEVAAYREQVQKDLSKKINENNKDSLAARYGFDRKAIENGDSTLSNELAKAISVTLGKLTDAIVDKSISVYKDYADKVNTRLIGVGKTFNDISNKTTKFVGLYSNTEYLGNVGKLVESGIAQNVEQRALLETLKDDLVTTFEVNNQTLERLIRIQQEDSSAARMGMEGYLNKFLNQNYQNTEYLTDLFDTVSGNIEEATSLLTASDAVSTEYAIQKWLGALYTQGMSSAGIGSIAAALGQLGSGNINDLVGTNIGNLMAMASKGNFGNLLKNGLSEATVNILMGSIVEYLQQLNNSGNNVVRSQLARTFGLSISDLKAAANVNTSNLTGTLSSSQASSYLGSLLGTVGNRITTAELIDNFVDNLAFAFGSQIVESRFLYSLYKAGQVANDILPIDIEAAPFGVGISAKLGDIFKMGSLLGSTIGLVGDLLGGAPAIENLVSTYNRLGSVNISSGTGLGRIRSGSSETGYIGNSSGSDLYSNSLVAAKENTSDINSKVSGNNEDDINVVVPNIYKYLVNVLDNKMDIIVGLTASIADYSVVDSFGTKLNMSMNTILGGTSAIVTANPVDNTMNDNIASMTENVATITALLKSVIANGMLNVTMASIGSNTNTVNSTAKQWGLI